MAVSIDGAKLSGKDILEWAKSMGYTPKGQFMVASDYPDVAEFDKLCKGKGKDIWSQVIKRVRPAQEVEHMRKCLLLQKIKDGEFSSGRPVPDSDFAGKQLALLSRLKETIKKRDEVREKVCSLELAIGDKAKVLKKSVMKTRESVRQIEECKRKSLILSMKRKECETTVQWLKDLTEVANDLCPPAPDAKPRKANTSAEAVVEKCLEAVREYHLKTAGDCDEDSQKLHHRTLWETLRAQVSGWGALHLWNAITVNLMNQRIAEMEALCLPFDSLQKADQYNENDFSTLNGLYLQTLLETVQLKAKAAVKSSELEKLQEKIFETFEAHYSASDKNVTVGSPEEIKHWIALQAKQAICLAKKKSLLSEIARMQEHKIALDSHTHKLKEGKETISQLDLETAQEKKLVEENLSRISCAALKLKQASARVMKRLENVNHENLPFAQCLSDSVMSNGSSTGTASVRKPTRRLISPYKSIEMHLNSPGLYEHDRAPLSSTMISNVTVDSGFGFPDTTAILHDSAVSTGSEGLGSVTSEMISVLRDAISKEAKLFFKLPLETVPRIQLNADSTKMECSLLALASSSLYHVTSTAVGSSYKKVLQIIPGVPVASSIQIILHQLHSQSHMRALLISKILNERTHLAPVCAPSSLEYLNATVSKQEQELHEHLDEIVAVYDTATTVLSTCEEDIKIWLHQPMQDLVPPSLKVKEATFNQWCKQYDKMHNTPRE